MDQTKTLHLKELAVWVGRTESRQCKVDML
jgi:hypothetical protein